MDYSDRTVVGLTERVKIINSSGVRKTLVAKVDTGADRSSIDESLVRRLGLGPIAGYKIIKQVSGKGRRPYVKVRIKIGTRVLNVNFSIADRRQMRNKILIGKNILKRNFIIDPLKKPSELK